MPNHWHLVLWPERDGDLAAFMQQLTTTHVRRWQMIFTAPVSGYFLTKVFLEARATVSWPSVTGMLTKAEVVGAGVGRFRAAVAYSYRVGVVDFTGSRIRASDGDYDIRDGAVQELDGLIVGRPVAVYYNPSNPRQSVIHPGVGFQEYAPLFVPVVMLGIGIVGFWQLRRSRRRDWQPGAVELRP